MRFRKILSTCISLCLVATLVVATGGCDDLGAYENTEEYYSTFGTVVLLSAFYKEKSVCQIKESLYNKESRENFLAGQDGALAYSDYVYMAIPVIDTIEMDSLALYIQSKTEVTVYINVFVIDGDTWKAVEDNVLNREETTEITETTENVYDVSASVNKIGAATVQLKSENWDSFLLDSFYVGDSMQKSMEIIGGQYILLQIRNNIVARDADDKRTFIDPQSGLELRRADITMTNLLIRSLDVETVTEVQGGE